MFGGLVCGLSFVVLGLVLITDIKGVATLVARVRWSMSLLSFMGASATRQRADESVKFGRIFMGPVLLVVGTAMVVTALVQAM